jgi:hypothetical protein
VTRRSSLKVPVWERRLRQAVLVVLGSVGAVAVLIAAYSAYLILYPLAGLVLAFALLVLAGVAALTFAVLACARAHDQLSRTGG